ncbi:MAG: ABC transporter substrate-binding protein [Marinosulfonomonas sp.]|nr:ABC transporter substrate-binding protein [Marinosulfonomonas sp.]
MFFRVFRHEAFDISEMSFSSYCVKTARGESSYTAVPVFLSRAFRHTSVYIRTDRGIETPQDLKGRRIGIAEWQLSANVWIRGILEDDYGLKASDIEWVRGGMDTPGRPEKIAVQPPAGVTLVSAPDGANLSDMLATGEIDGFIGPRSPRCFNEGAPNVGRLFADSVDTAGAYFKRTGVFPIMHLLGVRKSLAEAHPWLPGALFKAFSAAKSMAEIALDDTSATKVTMPFVEDNLHRARALMGRNIWSYGVAGNEATLNSFLDYHHREGLSEKRLTIEQLFHPATLESYSL